ncbi:hypothetical protein [Bacillus sp. ISTL8]|uniref:hypothetical protein n=1 Tax=Bacillus sp. ISTL8 TaxID=2596896 RepID=UPI0014568CE3|nr:hypothetical protein [Bacillus sp. ISTL8]
MTALIEPVLLGEFYGWDEGRTGADLIAYHFEEKEEYIGSLQILLASYDIEGCEGDAFVLFLENGKMYEVHGSHCSCFGLENQWNPEETTIKELEFRLNNGGGSEAWRLQLLLVLDNLKSIEAGAIN